MFSFGAQTVLAGYLILVSGGTPVLRAVMMRRDGARGFVPWGEFWGKWGADFATKLLLVLVLYWGGFWQ